MVTEIFMPKMGQTMEEGRILRWLKSEGDRVEKGEIVLEVETDKSTFEVEANGSGVLRKIIFQEEEVVPIATTLGFVAEPDEEIPEVGVPKKEIKCVSDDEIKTDPKQVSPAITATAITGEIKVAPRARRLAQEKGIDLSKITPSSSSGIISVDDIEKYLRSQKDEMTGIDEVHGIYEIKKTEKLNTAQTRMIQRLKESLNTALHTAASLEIDATAMKAKLTGLSREHPEIKISFTCMLVQLVAKVLREVPEYNAVCDGRSIKYIKQINIGVAVSAPSGLVVPVILNADTKDILEIAENLRMLIDKAKQGKLMPEEYSYGTFTISNLGMLGLTEFNFAILNPPESAILGVGATVDRPVVMDKQIVIRPIFKVTLTYDHRIA